MSQTSGIGFKRTASTGNIPVFQHDKALKVTQGGFVIDKTNLTPGQILLAGTPVIFDEAARTLVAMHIGRLYAAASNTAVTYQVNKNANFKVGDNFAATVSGAAYPITAVDTKTSTAYDTITVGTTLGVTLNAGQTVFASSATGASSAVLPAVNGLLLSETQIEDGVSQFATAVIRGTVYARRIPYSTQLAALPGLAHIIFSQSF